MSPTVRQNSDVITISLNVLVTKSDLKHKDCGDMHDYEILTISKGMWHTACGTRSNIIGKQGTRTNKRQKWAVYEQL